MRYFKLPVLMLLAAGCASTPYDKYRNNAQVILDELEKSAPNFVADAPIPEDARVALLNLDGRLAQSENPSESVYDHLAIALSKRGVFIVERDAEGLEASVLESWSDRLPFVVSSPCRGRCTEVDEKDDSDKKRKERDRDFRNTPPIKTKGSKKKSSGEGAKDEAGPTLIIQTCAKNSCDANQASCNSCSEPLLATSAEDILKINNLLSTMYPEKEKEDLVTTVTKVGEDPKPLSELPVEKRSYSDVFGRVQLPSWFKKDGSKIVAEQSSATHIMAYRVLTLGTHIEPDSDTTIRRQVRVDLILRLIRTKDGVVVWSNRVKSEDLETFPRAMEGRLKASPYRFFPSQFAPGSREAPLLTLPGGW